MGGGGRVEVVQHPQGSYVDAVRWLPPLAAFDSLLTTATHDFDSGTSSIEIHSLTQQSPVDAPKLELQTSWMFPSRVSALRVAPSSHKTIIAASSRMGHLHFLMANLLEASLVAESSLGKALHVGPISGMDLEASTCECVSVGEDGRINVVRLAEAELRPTRIFDNGGLVSYTAVRWTSPTEFVTAGLGLTLQCWDHRKPGGPVSHSPQNWTGRSIAGVLLSIDVPSSIIERPYLCELQHNPKPWRGLQMRKEYFQTRKCPLSISEVPSTEYWRSSIRRTYIRTSCDYDGRSEAQKV